MRKCVGIDPGQPQWTFATLQVASGKDIEDLDIVGEQPVGMSYGFYRWAEEQLGRLRDLNDVVQGEGIPLDYGARVRLKARIAQNDLSRFFHKHCEKWGEPDYLGFVHPYFADPAVRRSLPLLVAGEAISRQGESDLASAPRQCELRSIKLSAIDAPSAACLDLVARREVCLPAHLLLLTGPPAAAELAAVRLELADSQLQLKFHMVARLDPGTLTPILPKRVGSRELREWPDATQAGWKLRECIQWSGAANSLQIAYFGAALREAAESIREETGDPTILLQEVDEWHLAVGAARYAALCGLNELPSAAACGSSSSVRSLRVDHVYPRPLGIVGTNGRGAWFWRGLFSASQPLGGASFVVHSGPTPDRILLAESELVALPLWISQSDWARWGLRHFLTGVPEPSVDVPEGTMKFLIENPSGRTSYRWSDYGVRISVGKAVGLGTPPGNA